MDSKDFLIKYLAYQEEWNKLKDRESPFTLKGVSHVMNMFKDNIYCEHDYDIYHNEYGEKVAVCSKCLKAYF